MNNKIIFEDLGVSEYQKTWDYQEQLMQMIIDQKKEKKENPEKLSENHLLFVEHPHVYTLGKSGDEQNLLLNYIQLQAAHASFVKTNRGGDITYHGPGQIVGYPIFDLENFGIGLRKYIELMEEAIIKTIAEFGLEGSRDPKATGVWLDVGKPTARKICAIGVKSSRFVTMHGFAFNVNTDLNYFQHINPCGFTDRGVTSLEKELGEKQDFEAIKKLVLQKLMEAYNGELA
ncbi:lipoyl(octanoyl) transferase LipB [Roseimarinus sediminis]|jgi:lipoyl(octanoyl) transferase|uniref:lipoyl(octanoyl) transferase LipB n=1 Tax=Roseimarinus sediminis TaxID=1610899 RepID=UPI003D1C74B4